MQQEDLKINDTAILRLRKNNDLYRHLQETKYKNLRTGVEWDIADEQAKDVFELDVQASLLFNKYPLLEEMVFKLKLKIEKV